MVKDIHGAVAAAVRKGTIKKEPCKKCGRAKAVAHHPDYSKPLKVVWLCQSCHVSWHANNKALNRDKAGFAMIQFRCTEAEKTAIFDLAWKSRTTVTELFHPFIKKLAKQASKTKEIT